MLVKFTMVVPKSTNYTFSFLILDSKRPLKFSHSSFGFPSLASKRPLKVSSKPTYGFFL